MLNKFKQHENPPYQILRDEGLRTDPSALVLPPLASEEPPEGQSRLATGLQFPSGVSGAREMALEIPMLA